MIATVTRQADLLCIPNLAGQQTAQASQSQSLRRASQAEVVDLTESDEASGSARPAKKQKLGQACHSLAFCSLTVAAHHLTFCFYVFCLQTAVVTGGM